MEFLGKKLQGYLTEVLGHRTSKLSLLKKIKIVSLINIEGVRSGKNILEMPEINRTRLDEFVRDLPVSYITSPGYTSCSWWFAIESPF